MVEENKKVTAVEEKEDNKEIQKEKPLVYKSSDDEITEEFELPSKALGYENISSIVHMRPMKVTDEKLVLQYSGNFNRLVTELLNRCVIENINAEKLYTGDRLYLLFMLRAISYDVDYNIGGRCTACDTKIVKKINLLKDLEIKIINKSSDLTKMVKLPVSGKSITVQNLKGDDEAALVRRAKSEEDSEYLHAMAMKVNKIEGEDISYSVFLRVISSLVGKDSKELRKAMAEVNFGLPNSIVLDCGKCGESNRFALELDESFFGTEDEGMS